MEDFCSSFISICYEQNLYCVKIKILLFNFIKIDNIFEKKYYSSVRKETILIKKVKL